MSWTWPGHGLEMAKSPQIMQTACPVWTFEFQFDGDFMHVAPHTYIGWSQLRMKTDCSDMIPLSFVTSIDAMNTKDHGN